MSDRTHSPIDPLVDAIARRVVALLRESPAPATTDELLSEKQVLARYGMGRAALDARKLPKSKVGRAWKWRSSVIEGAIAGAATLPKPPKKRVVLGVNEDPIDAMLARGELRRVSR